MSVPFLIRKLSLKKIVSPISNQKENKTSKIYNVLKKDEMYCTLYTLNQVEKTLDYHVNTPTPFVPKYQNILGIIPMVLLLIPIVPFLTIFVISVDLINKQKMEG